MSYHPPPEERPASALSRGQWALVWVAGGLATVALALLVAREGPVAPVMLAAPSVAAAAPVPAAPAPRAPVPIAPEAAPPAPTVAQVIARAMAALAAPGSATARYCAASAALVTVHDPADKRQGSPEVDRAWRALGPAERAALREQRAAFADGRGLICEDGQRSSTCSCRGSHGGCCSRHGGVRGCEPLPDRVSCAAKGDR